MNLYRIRNASRLCAMAMVLAAVGALAQSRINLATDVGLDQKLDQQLPLDAVFLDETGKEVQLGEYFGKRPVILGLIYYRCPQLCNQVLNGLLGSLRILKFDAGKEFDVVLISIDPRETPELATGKKRSVVSFYKRPTAESGFHFLVGDEKQINRVADAIGYRYKYDPESDLYAHAAGVIVVTPQGRLSKYFYGIEYSAKDLRLALIEASENRIGSLVEQVLLWCSVYDPATGKYSIAILQVLKLLGIVTVLALGTYIAVMVGRERRRRAKDHLL